MHRFKIGTPKQRDLRNVMKKKKWNTFEIRIRHRQCETDHQQRNFFVLESSFFWNDECTQSLPTIRQDWCDVRRQSRRKVDETCVIIFSSVLHSSYSSILHTYHQTTFMSRLILTQRQNIFSATILLSWATKQSTRYRIIFSEAKNIGQIA